MISSIMIQAFGIDGYVLTEKQAMDIFPGWQQAFRGIPTEHLERVRVQGLERRCKKAVEFVVVYEAGMEAEARECEYQWQKREAEQRRASAVPAGVISSGKAACLAAWREQGLLR